VSLFVATTQNGPRHFPSLCVLQLHLHVAITRRSNCRSLGPAIEQRAVGNRRSLNRKVLLLLATFRAVKCLFSHNNWTTGLSHSITPPSLPRPPLSVLQRVIVQIFSLKSPALAVGPFCAVHLQRQPQPAVFTVMSVCLCLSVSVYLVNYFAFTATVA